MENPSPATSCFPPPFPVQSGAGRGTEGAAHSAVLRVRATEQCVVQRCWHHLPFHRQAGCSSVCVACWKRSALQLGTHSPSVEQPSQELRARGRQSNYPATSHADKLLLATNLFRWGRRAAQPRRGVILCLSTAVLRSSCPSPSLPRYCHRTWGREWLLAWHAAPRGPGFANERHS